MAELKPEIIEQFCKNSVPLFEFLNVSFEFLGDGVLRCHLPFNRQVGNYLNSVYAGVQWSIAEVLGGIAFATASISGYVPLLKSMNIEFKKPATTDLVAQVSFSEEDIQRMRDAILKDGRYDFEMESNIKDTNGNVVATGLALYAIRKMK